jgi:hypothetical protein
MNEWQSGRRAGGPNNKGFMVLAAILGAGIVVGLVFIVAVLVQRPQVAEGSLTPLVTPRPTFTVTPAGADVPTPTEPGVPAPTDTAAPVSPSETSVVPTQAPSEVATEPQATEPPQPTATTPPPAGKPVKMRSPDYGMQAFLWWRPEVAQRDMELIRDAGFGWVKQGFACRPSTLPDSASPMTPRCWATSGFDSHEDTGARNHHDAQTGTLPAVLWPRRHS